MKMLFLQNVWSNQHQQTFAAGTTADVDFPEETIAALISARAIELVPESPQPEPKVKGRVQPEE